VVYADRLLQLFRYVPREQLTIPDFVFQLSLNVSMRCLCLFFVKLFREMFRLIYEIICYLASNNSDCRLVWCLTPTHLNTLNHFYFLKSVSRSVVSNFFYLCWCFIGIFLLVIICFIL
jgi:hypothetical protein